jgi:hypothetical protein
MQSNNLKGLIFSFEICKQLIDNKIKFKILPKINVIKFFFTINSSMVDIELISQLK